MSVNWTPDNDQRLLEASIPIQNVIDEIEAWEARGGPPLSQTLNQEYVKNWHTMMEVIVRFLRKKKSKDKNILMRSKEEWHAISEELTANSRLYSCCPKKKLDEVRSEIMKLLEIEKARQFVYSMDPHERKIVFDASRKNLEAMQAEIEAEFKEDGISSYERHEMNELITKFCDAEKAKEMDAGYKNERAFVDDEEMLFDCSVEYDIRERLRDLFNPPK